MLMHTHVIRALTLAALDDVLAHVDVGAVVEALPASAAIVDVFNESENT